MHIRLIFLFRAQGQTVYLCQEDGQDAENNDDYLYLSRWADSGLSINFEAEGSISVKDGDTSLFCVENFT